jgi:hypothetical protein
MLQNSSGGNQMVLCSGTPVTTKSDYSRFGVTPGVVWSAFTNKGLVEVRLLKNKLQKLAGVQQVKLVFKKPGDLHNVVFQIKTKALVPFSEEEKEEIFNEPDSDEMKNLWNNAQDLVLQTCKHLRETTGEKWYFRTQLVEDFGNEGFDL